MDKIYKLLESNTIVYEDLSDIEVSVFEDSYKAADRTLLKVIRDNEKSRENDNSKKNSDLIGNVIAFLGGRGRGKTSTMLSFLSKMNSLKNYSWSYFCNREEKNFLILQYIDAAMLAENEFIIDVVLAEMWDLFETELGNTIYSQEIAYRKGLENQIKQQFVKTRQAYMVSQQHEFRQKGKDCGNDLPTVSALHELAASINLRQEMIVLVREYLEFFNSTSADRGNCLFETNKKREQYLVIAIDDIDMSGGKSYYILEQIRRYLSIPNVIVMVTSDIDRLHKACEKRYEDLYRDERDRQQVISEYLEKILPYNMRVYLPELREKHGKIILNTKANEELGISSIDEKDFILEFMIKKCGLYFDPTRRKRHFLQNYTMRSMVNYFEQLVRLKNIDYKPWLKTDIKERLIERISNREQKEFMQRVLSKDYEIINDCILSYIRDTLEIGEYRLGNGGLGYVLYGCNLLENSNEENAEFVNCVIMLYSVILKSVDSELRNKIWGDTIWGNWEYNISSEYYSELMQNFSEKGKLEFDIDYSEIEKFKRNSKKSNPIKAFIERHIIQIKAWAAMLMFVTIVTDIDGEVKFKVDFKEKKEVSTKEEETNEIKEKKILGYSMKLMPQAEARKTYLSCSFEPSIIVYKIVCKGIEEIVNHIYQEFNIKKDEVDVSGAIDNILKKELTFLYTEDIKNVDEIADNEIIDTSAVEIVYSIGRAMNKVTLASNNDENGYYNVLKMKYKVAVEKLEKIKKYYIKNLNVNEMPKFVEIFQNSKQVKILSDPNYLGEEVYEKFKDNMQKLLLEARRAEIFRTVIDPDR